MRFQFRAMTLGLGQLKAQRVWITMADLFYYTYYMKSGAQMQNVYGID